MNAADQTPLVPIHVLRDPKPSGPGGSMAVDLDDYVMLTRAPSATMRALARGEREHPPSRRPLVIHALRIGEAHKVHISVGLREDGTVREFFVDIEHKEGAPLRAIGIIVATSNSLAQQHGAPLRSVCAALRAAYFEPAGMVTGHTTITHTDSLFDLVAQVLEDEDAAIRAERSRT